MILNECHLVFIHCPLPQVLFRACFTNKPSFNYLIFPDSSKRPHPSERHGFNHSPYPPYLPSNSHHQWTSSSQSQSSRGSITEKVQDISAPQPPISDQFLQKLIVLQDYCASKDGELTIRRGERIEVVQREVEWLYIRNERGKEGYVPSKNCAPPVASSSRRTRKSSQSSVPLRAVASGETSRLKDGIPLFSTNSAGHIKRYNSPVGVSDSDKSSFRRISSPLSNVSSPLVNGSSIDKNVIESTSILEPKNSPSSSSGVASLVESYSPAILRTYSQEELNPTIDTHNSLSQSAVIIPPDVSTSLAELAHDVHSKQSSSDDSGTVDISQFKDNEYASTIQNETSSEEGSIKQARDSSASRGTTPSVKDRPLPVPPHSTDEDVPPPIPPRHDSLSRNKPSLPTPDDIDPYSNPVDNVNAEPRFINQSRVKSLIDIHYKDSGVNSPYSEVYRGKRNKRPVNLSDTRESSPAQARRSASFSRRRSPQSNMATQPIERRGSPHVNGERRLPPTPLDDGSTPAKGVVKFRKCLWGVYVCTQVR